MFDFLILYNFLVLKNLVKLRINNNLVCRWDKLVILFFVLKIFDMILEVMGCFLFIKVLERVCKVFFKVSLISLFEYGFGNGFLLWYYCIV